MYTTSDEQITMFLAYDVVLKNINRPLSFPFTISNTVRDKLLSLPPLSRRMSRYTRPRVHKHYCPELHVRDEDDGIFCVAMNPSLVKAINARGWTLNGKLGDGSSADVFAAEPGDAALVLPTMDDGETIAEEVE